MFSTGDRLRLRLLRLAYRPEYAQSYRKIRTKIYGNIRSVLRFTLVAGFIGFFLLSSLVLSMLLPPKKVLKPRALFLKKICGLLLRILRFEVVLVNPNRVDLLVPKGSFILPNHISYLDVLAIHSLWPVRFVTSYDIGMSGFLGAICKRSGCLFVNRKARRDLLKNIDEISAALNDDNFIVLFPEGSTSPGDQLLTYKSSLIEAAMRSKTKVFPLCIRYREMDGHELKHPHFDKVAWYGDMSFLPHLWSLMKVRSLKIELTLAPPVHFRQAKCRKALTQAVREITAQMFYRLN